MGSVVCGRDGVANPIPQRCLQLNVWYQQLTNGKVRVYQKETNIFTREKLMLNLLHSFIYLLFISLNMNLCVTLPPRCLQGSLLNDVTNVWIRSCYVLPSSFACTSIFILPGNRPRSGSDWHACQRVTAYCLTGRLPRNSSTEVPRN